jgi:hypothetical protein
MVRTPFKLSRRILSQSRVIAKGRRIREVNRLVERYGGRASKWVEKSSPQLDVAGTKIEYHRYENPEIGRFEIKGVRTDQA